MCCCSHSVQMVFSSVNFFFFNSPTSQLLLEASLRIRTVTAIIRDLKREAEILGCAFHVLDY